MIVRLFIVHVHTHLGFGWAPYKQLEFKVHKLTSRYVHLSMYMYMKNHTTFILIGLTIGLIEGLHTRAFKSRTLAEKQDMGLLKHTYMYTHCKKRGKKRMMT